MLYFFGRLVVVVVVATRWIFRAPPNADDGFRVVFAFGISFLQLLYEAAAAANTRNNMD